VQLSGNAYYRHIRTATLNGDMNDDDFDQSVYQPARRNGRHGGRLHGRARQRRDGGQSRSGAASRAAGTNRRKSATDFEPDTRQANYGVSGQATLTASWAPTTTSSRWARLRRQPVDFTSRRSSAT
jgi:hypothetical protein